MSIRTTVTLDEDVLARTKEFSKEQDIPFRTALNELIRSGLEARTAALSAVSSNQRFRIEPFKKGLVPDLNYDDIEGLLELLEGPEHR